MNPLDVAAPDPIDVFLDNFNLSFLVLGGAVVVAFVAAFIIVYVMNKRGR